PASRASRDRKAVDDQGRSVSRTPRALAGIHRSMSLRQRRGRNAVPTLDTRCGLRRCLHPLRCRAQRSSSSCSSAIALLAFTTFSTESPSLTRGSQTTPGRGSSHARDCAARSRNASLRIESKLGAELSICAVLNLLDLPLHEIQPEHALLKSIRQTAEERCLMAILKQIERRDDRIGLLAGRYVIDERVDLERSQARKRGDGFREQPREKQR